MAGRTLLRIKLDYVVEVAAEWPAQFDVNDLIVDGLRHAMPDAVQVLPGARLSMTRLGAPPKAKGQSNAKNKNKKAARR